MMRTHLLCGIVLVGCCCLSFGTSNQQWSISDLRLSPNNDVTRIVHATVRAPASDRASSLSVKTALTKIRNSFQYRGKLVLLGASGGADAVVIVDLAAGTVLDWFYCYAPQQVSDNAVAYIEWFPRHADPVTDVVLLYDLDKSPVENRAQSSRDQIIPAPEKASPVAVGLPVYPELNARQQSYINAGPQISVPENVLANTFCLTPEGSLIFVAAQGSDFRSSRDYLVLVNLTRGRGRASAMTIPIPTADLKRLGENPNFIKVDRLTCSSATKSMQLSIPSSEYGVEQISVRLPAGFK